MHWVSINSKCFYFYNNQGNFDDDKEIDLKEDSNILPAMTPQTFPTIVDAICEINVKGIKTPR